MPAIFMIKNSQMSVQKKVKINESQANNKALTRNGDILFEYGVQCCSSLSLAIVNRLTGIRSLCCFIAIPITQA